MRGSINLNFDLKTQPLLDDAQTKHLISLAHAGDDEAREKLINSHLRLVANLIGRFQNRGYDAEDLFQIGAVSYTRHIQLKLRCEIFDLRRADDYRRNQAFSEGRQSDPRLALLKRISL